MYKIIGEPTSYSHPKNDKSFTYQREGDEMVFDYCNNRGSRPSPIQESRGAGTSPRWGAGN